MCVYKEFCLLIILWKSRSFFYYFFCSISVLFFPLRSFDFPFVFPIYIFFYPIMAFFVFITIAGRVDMDVDGGVVVLRPVPSR